MERSVLVSFFSRRKFREPKLEAFVFVKMNDLCKILFLSNNEVVRGMERRHQK